MFVKVSCQLACCVALHNTHRLRHFTAIMMQSHNACCSVDDDDLDIDDDDIGGTWLDDHAAEDSMDRKPASIKKVKLFHGNKNPRDAHGQISWMPIYCISQWKNGQMENMVTVAIILPSGVTKKEDSKVKVSDDLCELQVTVKWPSMLSNVAALHKFWNRKDENTLPSWHPKIVGFHDYFAGLREKEDEDLYATASIVLPLQVQKNIVDIHHFGDENGARIIYVELRGMENSSYKSTTDSDFIIL